MPIEAEYIIPPFSDPHIHGGWGCSFRSGDYGKLERKLRSLGVFFAIPTLNNDDIEGFKLSGAQFTEYKKNTPDTIFPFLRAEGPFISRKKKGCQTEAFIHEVKKEIVDKFLSIDELQLVTFAPEIQNVDVLIEGALKRKKILSAGHSDSRYSDFKRCYDLGVRHMTHFPNAMSEMHHRGIGLTGAGLLLDDVHLEVICDGIHNSFEFVQLILKTKGPVFSLISDLVQPAFSECGLLEGQKVFTEGRKITTEEGILAGGGMTVSEQVCRLYENGVEPEVIVKLACTNAPGFFGKPIPSLEEGEEATFLVLDDKMKVKAVFAKGIQVA
jgi:N-acetylglucosamine-6-phosphate deacetylase